MNQLLAIGGLSPMELIIIVGVIVLLFGSSKIPQLMRGVGSGINEFKKGLKEGGTKDALPEESEAVPATTEQKKPAETTASDE
jgi:sec-independent protein translocase protein TatA